MSAGLPMLTTAGLPGGPAERSPFAESIWRAPLVPVALAVTAGVVADRYLTVPLPASLLAALAGLLAWCCTRRSTQPGLSLVYLGFTAAALGAAYHHWHLHVYPADDIGYFTQPEARLIRIRGALAEEPTILWSRRDDPLRSFALSEPTVAVLRATALSLEGEWRPVSGRVRLVVGGHLQGLHVGDTVEVVGWLERPSGAANPGGPDPAAQYRDQRIRALLHVRETPEAVTRREERWPWTVGGWLAVVRGWGQRTLQETLPEHSGLAMALLLGEGSTMTGADWEKYVRTGVLHVLAVSGQHLVLLAVFLWWAVRLSGVCRSRGAWFIALFLLSYGLLTGGRPPVLRAVVMVCAVCGSLVLRRPALAANTFALAWLVVIGVNPTDVFTPGCQLSFLGTAGLFAGSRYLERETDSLEQLVEESRPAWQRMMLGMARLIGFTYLLHLLVWVAITPLLALHYHTISPVALLIGPPVSLLASAALLLGFQLLPCAVVFGPLASVLARLMGWCLAGCDGLVTLADQLEPFRWYVGTIPSWWCWGFYLALFGVFSLRALQVRWRWFVLAGAAWLCVGLLSGSARPAPEEFRCTFLSVGHGGCVVLETPDGRTLLYDAGALSGPDVTRRHIAPFLWRRGVRRIDELFVSHADLDHFNGIPALLERFAVGQVTCTPSFAQRQTAGVRAVLEAVERRRIPRRTVAAGDRLQAGEIKLDVLHPPWEGPEGNENSRSLVLLVEHAGRRILLTGDLEGPGLQRLLGLPPVPVEVLMAPHHGSSAANTPELAAWARPRVVISSQGIRHNLKKLAAPYVQVGAQFFDTAQHGAVTLRSAQTDLRLETFRTEERLRIISEPRR